MAVLRRIKRAKVRAMCGAKLMEKKRTEDLIKMLGLKETVVQMAKASKMEGGSWRDCCQSGVNPATPIYGDKSESKLD